VPREDETPVIDVVIPVYRGLEQTRRCIESVLRAPQATPHELVLIDDASPEPELSRYLDSLAGRDGVTVLRNPRNLGFVQTVNRGMRLHPDRDVVLLNSDTEVANDWLDRLRRCVLGSPDIATATPFSNNATICSYPVFCADNPMPPGITLTELDRLFARVNAGTCVDLPTAVGFCMYIRRACLDAIGLFDAERFARGYGEENDFSRRAAKAGWRNVLCADVFVFHAGGVSFQAEREQLMANAAAVLRGLHPEYDALVARFAAEDAPAHCRQPVDVALARLRLGLDPTPARPDDAIPRVTRLHVVHDHGGGIERWCRDFCRADAPGTNLVLAPYSASDAMGEGLVLYVGDARMEPLAHWPFATPIQAVTDTHPEYRQAIDAIVRDYGVGVVVVSSLIGHALDVLDTGLPTLVVNHDYFPLCPTINLHFGVVCRQCGDARLAECAAHNPNFNPFPTLSVAERLRVRTRYLECVTRKGTVMVVPDESVRAQLLQVFPALREAAFVTIPHGADRLPSIGSAADGSNGRLRVVVLGILPAHKGLQLLVEALPRLLEFADLYLVGAKEYGELFRDTPGVHFVDQYTLENLPGIVAAIRPDVGLLLSIVPETYSYTLSELSQLGIPPAATRLGAFASRIVPGETGYLFEPAVEPLLACLRAIDADRKTLRRIRVALSGLPARTAAQMVADYRRLMPASGMESTKPLHGGERDPAMLLALERARQWKVHNGFRRALEMKERRLCELNRRLGRLRDTLAEREQTIGRLEDDAYANADRLAEWEAQLAAVLASTSWRLSAPVRWVGDALRKLGQIQPSPAAQPPAAPETTGRKQEGDWRQASFHHYRETLAGAREAVRARIQAMPRRPLVSVLVTVRDARETPLRDMLDSVLRQWYPDWELCVAADERRLSPATRTVLVACAARDSRVRLAFGAGDEGNHALDMAAGAFVVLLGEADLLEEQALFRVAEAVVADDPDMLYSDEVRVAPDGETVRQFIFRPGFSPEYLRALPDIAHLAGFKPGLLKAVGGCDEASLVAQDIDLSLRAGEQAATVVHVPELLYRTRSGGNSNPVNEQAAMRAALERHLRRCGEAGTVADGPDAGFFDVCYPLVPGLRVAIVIPTKNHAELVRACIESIERTVGGVVHDIVLVDHESDDPVALAYFDSLGPRVTLLRYRGPFNFAAINNWAVAQLGGSHTHYLFCNNDVEAIEPGWLERMLELGQKPDIGVVGAKLYYPDRKTIQHAGVVVACCGVAENLGRFRETHDAPLDQGYLGSLICNREVSAVTGACMLVRRDVFAAIGGFDEAIAVGYGDVDLCLRAGQRGYRTLFCAHAALLHHESYTRGRMPEDPHPEDSARFLEKWRQAFAAGDPYFNPNLSSHSPNWRVAEPLEFKLDVHRRVFVRGQPLPHLK
jgi:GT2 family glycosyltransferase/glycosyltransferase involved in cell wall biosynthesis